MKNVFLLILLTASLLPILSAQESSHLSLDSLLNQVERNYPSVLQYQYNMQAWQAKAEGAKAWMPPTFSAGIMRFPYNLPLIVDRNSPMNQAGIGFSLEQMIPNKHKLKAKKDYLQSLAALEANKEAWTKNQLRREVKLLYYTRYVLEKKLSLLTESKELLELVILITEEKFSYNQSQLQTIYKAKASLAELKNMQFMLNSRIAESNIGLNSLMLRGLHSPFTIDSLILPSDYSILEMDTLDLSARSDIDFMSNSIQSMKLNQDLMKLGKKPDFGIRAEHMQMLGMPSQFSIMGMITVPIVPWSSKMYLSEEKAMDLQIEAMQLEKKDMELMAQRMLAEKLSMLNYEQQIYENYQKELIPAYENNLEANLLAYRQNTGDLFVLLDAWEMLLMKKMELYDKLLNLLRLQAEYDYEKELK